MMESLFPLAARPQSSVLRGRLAPSPTGLLHLGNAWSFLLAWLASRAEGGLVTLRMEDIDPARSRREWADAIVRDLRWLGLDWDEGPDCPGSAGEDGPNGPYEQSRRGAYYEAALTFLERAGHVYPCFCTRKELRDLAGAPHGGHRGQDGGDAGGVGDMGAPYPGRCRGLTPEEAAARKAEGRAFSWRLACPEGEEGEDVLAFDDAVLGRCALSFAACGGDFALRRSDGVWAYQLAVSVDDALMGVTRVVRGEDIVWSTPRQLLLLRLLGAPAPSYAHVPLLCDSNGERLAKRHHSLSLHALREAGARPEAVVGALAHLAGLAEPKTCLTPAALAARLRAEGAFPWERLRRGPVRLPAMGAILLFSSRR